MTARDKQASARWHRTEAVVAAYAGTGAGIEDFSWACRALRRALPDARISMLCPADARVRNLDDSYTVVEYPSPSARQEIDRAAVETALRAVEVLSTGGARAALVFAERGIAPYAPAYLCYLAGIEYRAGYEAEFGGAVLSPSFRLPGDLDDAARHLALLAAVGLERDSRSASSVAAAAPGTRGSRVMPAVAEQMVTIDRRLGCDR